MKVLYFWDENMVYDHSVVYKNDSDVPNPLPANATTVAPKNGSYQPIHWNGVDGWKGSTREEYLASLPAPKPATPTTEQQSQADLLLQMAQIKTDQAAFNSQIMLQVASLKNGAMKLADGSTTTAPTTDTVTTPTEQEEAKCLFILSTTLRWDFTLKPT